MRSVRLAIVLIIIACAAVEAAHPATAAEPKQPVTHFLPQSLDAADIPLDLPPDAKEVVIAKVRFARASYLGGRHGEGITDNIYSTRIKIIEVKQGRAEVGQVFDVRMGLRSDPRKFAYPSTPSQLEREYTAVVYLSDDGLRRLATFPISPAQYDQWEAERSAHHRKRMKPGALE